MSDPIPDKFPLPRQQQAIRDKCVHPSGTFVEFPIEDVETSIAARFEKIVKRYSDYTAIKIGKRVVTYAELNGIANRVSRAVAAHGGNSAVPVALLFEKGIEQIAAMIGVLKAGRFFVLLDSSSPKPRFEVILEDCSPDLTITDRQNISLAKDLMRKNQLLIEIESIDDNIPIDNFHRDISSDTLAFIVHTSGSSGLPKGVIHDHRTVLHHLMLRSNADGFCPQDRIPNLTSGTSNAITTSFGVLLNGAALLPFDVKKEGVGCLSRWLVQEKITILPIAAPLFRNLCEVLTEADRFPDIRLLRLSSETVCKSDIDLYKRYFSDYSLLVNGLNSSETHMLAEYIIERDTKVPGDDVPVGYAARDKEILLLDEQGAPVGYNEIGEIVVRSKYLSPGYWRNPQLTAVKFRRDPVDSEKRLYDTGDLGLMLPDGCLIHKGRKDLRVKIRGYGVELGEVERSLQSHPAVSQTVVVAREDRTGESRLIAYYTSLQTKPHSVSEFRTFIREKLPDYMVPSAFVRLDCLPLTSNGKVDRRALPDPGSRRPELDAPFIAPRTDLEKTVARIFFECTGIEAVGIEDNFFDLGGDSLMLARLVSRLTIAFQHEFSVGELFECPSVAGIARLLKDPRQSLSPMVETIRCASASSFPNLLSFAQQRLWFLDQLNPEDPAYNLLAAFQINGNLNIAALERSLNAIIARHEVLRTVFESVDGQPRIKVLTNMTISLNLVDLGERQSVLEDEAVFGRYCTALARQPFDLSRGPLLRVSLLRRGEDDFVLLFAVHHIVFDGWSMGVLWSDVSACYEAFCQGKQVSLPKLAVQYADYAHWQRDRLKDYLLQKQLEYWQRQLTGSSFLQLLTDRPRPNVQTSRGAKRYFTLSVDVSTKLKRLSHNHGATLFMTLMAAFQTLLHRYTSQGDIAIGCPVAGRNHPEVENLIGFFINLLIFRVDVSGEPNFLELLGRVRQVCLAAYAHQELPFEKLVEELHPERHLSRNPLVDVAFAFQNTPHAALKLGGASVSHVDVDSGICRFDLQLFMEEAGDQLRGNFSYNADLFDDPTIARMAEHFVNLLESIVVDPDQPIGQLTLLGAPERQQILGEWNDTQRDYPKDKCIHHLFETQVEKTPYAIAPVFEDEQLTYRELNNRANQLAHYLRKLGVGPEILVGVCVERSLEMIVGILGILKAGGAYVPLDPRYPEERLAFMLEDSRAPVLITQSFLIERLPTHNATVLCLDRDWEEISTEEQHNPVPLTTPDNLAYVIYTSGTTGIPKGALIAHHNVVRLFRATESWFHFNPEDVWTLFHSYAFDLSVWEIWGALLYGGRLVVVPFEVSRSPQEFYELLCREQVTILNQTPSAFRQLVQAEESMIDSGRLGVRLVILGGEALDFHSLKPWFDRHGDQKPQLINMYGITEATVHVTYRVIKEADLTGSMPSLIGAPIPDLELYVLDSYRNLVPIGVPGELYVGGAGLARGYLNRSELTAERFLDHAFADGKVKRLYRSGDLVRRRADGDIEYLGRLDNQVKIRGHRIELGEIESVLARNAAIRQSVVLAREDSPGERRLVAYAVANAGANPSASELRSFLQKRLPDYMVPAVFVLVDSLPLTPNGKIDRKALPEPDQRQFATELSYLAPRNELENIVADIWAEVLKLEKIGIHDNFFELGGHSLLATQVISRLWKVFHGELPLRSLFENPTVAGLAANIERLPSKQTAHQEVIGILADLEQLSDNEAAELASRSQRE